MKEKNDNNTIFIPLNNDNEWVSVKRDINYRLVYKDTVNVTLTPPPCEHFFF